tara:strand:- start:451 stop:1299 length:849 start_codon:yes stop_codon:yes gene_type:complete
MIIWIASYPKSGNTWLRALLSSYYFSKDGFFNQNYLKKIAQFPEKRHFKDFNYNSNVVTDTSKFWIQAQELINKDSKIKLIKTHNILGGINNSNFTDSKNTLAAVYIVRDPRNIITSLQNHYEMTSSQSLEFMLNEKKYIYDHHKRDDYSDFQFISSWEKHYQSWLNQKDFPVKMIKYENLINNLAKTFEEVIEFISKISNSKDVYNKIKAKNSIQSTTFEKMKNIEERDGFFESALSKNESKKIPFFYLGPKNNWKDIFDKDFQKKINSTFKINLKELNYT